MNAAALEEWLRETPQLDLSHPRLRITAHKLTQSLQTLPERAAAVQRFVRRLPYTAAARPGVTRASRILEQGQGDGHAKAVLFTALCRAAGLPARLQFLRVRSAFLAGIQRDRPEAIDHAVAQVYVEGRWISTDGYVIDPPLFARAKQRLHESDLDSGWGIVRDATGAWDGRSACLHQFHWDDVLLSYGIYDDVRDFLASAGRQDAGWAASPGRWARTWLLNRRVARLRRAGHA